MAKPSRKKFQEALRALKQACKNDRLPFRLRVHAAELIMCIYGVPLPDNNPRIKRAVKDLVAENAFDVQLKDQVQAKMLEEAEAQARAFLERINDSENNWAATNAIER